MRLKRRKMLMTQSEKAKLIANLFSNQEGYKKFCADWELLTQSLKSHKVDLSKIEIVIRKDER